MFKGIEKVWQFFDERCMAEIVIDFECVGSRTLYIKFKFSIVKARVLVVYGPTEALKGMLRKWRGSGAT